MCCKVAKVKAGKEYVFFSEKAAPSSERNNVTEYKLTCENTLELNELYVIFSTNEFTKANDNAVKREHLLPRELPFEDFQNWLTENMTKDKNMKRQIKSLTIKK